MKKVLTIATMLFIAITMIAASGFAQVTIKNRSQSDLYVWLYPIEDGVPALSPSASFYILPKTVSTFQIPAAEYRVVADMCGLTFTYDQKIAGNFTITAPPCQRISKTNQMVDGGMKTIPE